MASHYLAGRNRLPGRFPAVLAELIGKEGAQAVLALIPDQSNQQVA